MSYQPMHQISSARLVREERLQDQGSAPDGFNGGAVEMPDYRSASPTTRDSVTEFSKDSDRSKHFDLPRLETSYERASSPAVCPSPTSPDSNWRGQAVVIKAGPNSGSAGMITSWVGDQVLVQFSDNSDALVDPQDLELVSSRGSSWSSSSRSQGSRPTTPSPSYTSPHPVKKNHQVPKPRRRSGPKLKLVGKFVKIISGRHLGQLGFVTRGANGYYSVAFSADSPIAHEVVMKRAGDLKEIDRPDNFVDGPNNKLAMELFKEGEPPKKRKRSRPMSGKDSWIAQKVVVREGKYRGEVGLVKRSGHGFYCVDFPQHGEVMKRGIDLELYNPDSASPYHPSPSPSFNIDQLQLSPATKKTYQRMKMSSEKMIKTVSSSHNEIAIVDYDAVEEMSEDKQEERTFEHEQAASILVEMLQRCGSESERSGDESERSDSGTDSAEFLEDFDSLSQLYVPARQFSGR